MVLLHILEGVGLHRAHVLAVDQHLGDGVALIRGDGEGLIPTLADADIAGGRDGAVHACSGLDGVVGVTAAAAAAAVVDPVGLDGDVLIRHDKAGVLAAGAEDGHIVGGPAVEGVAGLGSGVDIDRGSCRMAASAGSAGARAAQGDVVILGSLRVGDLDGKLLRVRAAAIGGLDGELEIAGLGGRTLDGVAHQRQAVRQSADLDAPSDGVGAGGSQGLAVRIAHLAVRQGNGGDGGLGGNIGALGGIEGVGQDHAVRVVIAGQDGADRGRLALDGVIGGLNGEYACASGLQRDLHGVDRTGLELAADGKGRTVRSHPLGICHGVGAVGGGGLSRGSVLDGLCNGQVLHHDAGQHGNRGVFAALRVAVSALLMLLARRVGGCCGVYHPLPVMVGGFGVVCGFAELLALGAGTAMGGIIILRPCGEVVGFKLHITACAASGMLAVVQHRPIAVAMRMGGCQRREGVADLTIRISCHIAVDGVDAVCIEAVAARCGHRDGNGVGRCAKLVIRHRRGPFRCANGVQGVVGSGGRGCGGFAVFRGGNRQRNAVDLAGIGCLVPCEDTISGQIIRMILSVSAVCSLVGNIIRLCNVITAVLKLQFYRIEIRLIRRYRTSYWGGENVFVYGGRKFNIIRKVCAYKLGCREALTNLVIQRRQLDLDLQTGSDNSIILQFEGSGQDCCFGIKRVIAYIFNIT